MPRHLRRALLPVLLPILLPGCATDGKAVVPVPTIAHPLRPEQRAPTLMVFLPGRRSPLGDFERHEFFDLARQRGLDADLVETGLHLGYYADGTSARRIWEDVVAPARASGYHRVWLVGISLGGSGAIGFAREHPGAVAGIILLSPFLGPPEMLARIRESGGIEAWKPDPTAGPGSFKWFIEQNWDFLRKSGAAGEQQPVLFLGYGRDEPMVPSLDLLAGLLPAENVVRVPGNHRWNTWRTLWAEILPKLDLGS